MTPCADHRPGSTANAPLQPTAHQRQGREDARRQPGKDRQPGREHQRARIDANPVEPRYAGRCQAHHDVHPDERKHASDDGCGDGDQQAFREQEGGEAALRGAERNPQRELGLPPERPPQQEVGSIETGDERDQSYAREEGDQGCPGVAHHELVHRREGCPGTRVLVRELLPEAAVCGVEHPGG